MLWDEKTENSNQSIYWSKNIDTFCSECSEHILACEFSTASIDHNKKIDDIVKNKVVGTSSYHPRCLICKKEVIEDYYGVCFEKVFLSEFAIETIDSYFVNAFCSCCNNAIMKRYYNDKISADFSYYSDIFYNDLIKEKSIEYRTTTANYPFYLHNYL